MNYPPRAFDHVNRVFQTLLEMIAPILIAACLAGIAVVIFTIPMWLLWNWIMPDIFGVKALSLFQALGLNLLISLLIHSKFSFSTKD